VACMTASCAKTESEALPLQAKIAAEFLSSKACRDGRVVQEYAKVMAV